MNVSKQIIHPVQWIYQFADTPPPNNDLLSMNTPQHPIGQSASSSNLIKDHGIETSLFGDELDAKTPDQSSQKNKDSIMALYGSGSQQKQPAYGVPGKDS